MEYTIRTVERELGRIHEEAGATTSMNDDLLAGGAEGEASRIDVVDEICDQFEQAWRSGQPPQLSKYLDHMPETADPEVRRDLLVELVMIDLECRWQAVYTEIDGVIGSGADEAVRSDPSNILPERPLLEDYVQRIPITGASQPTAGQYDHR